MSWGAEQVISGLGSTSFILLYSPKEKWQLYIVNTALVGNWTNISTA